MNRCQRRRNEHEVKFAVLMCTAVSMRATQAVHPLRPVTTLVDPTNDIDHHPGTTNKCAAPCI